MTKGKTSTFTIHHDTCKPAEWTPKDILLLADFVRTGDMTYAARLSRLGVQLVLSEHHVPKGGELQEVGWASWVTPIDLVSDDISEVIEDEDIAKVTRVYRGPVEYAVRIPMGDGDGNFDGYEYEFKATEAEADAYLASLQETETADTPA